jgi:hypothetical protein
MTTVPFNNHFGAKVNRQADITLQLSHQRADSRQLTGTGGEFTNRAECGLESVMPGQQRQTELLRMTVGQSRQALVSTAS